MRSCVVLRWLLLGLLSTVVCGLPQFHLSLIGNAPKSPGTLDYMLDWVTPSTATASTVVFGTSPSTMTQQLVGKVAGLVEETASSSVACWSALLSNVRRGDTIYYALQDKPGSIYSFVAPLESKGMTWAVFGDLAAPIQGKAAAVSWPALWADVDRGAYQGVLNLGDIGYELSRENGRNYMEAFENITSKVPMQLTIGNHEHQYQVAPMLTLQNYRRRFNGLKLGAGAASGSNSNEFFSFSDGLVHFAVLNTEVYGDEAFYAQDESGAWSPNESAKRSLAVTQAAWLEYDLSRVNRTVTPFVVVGGHRPPFKTPLGLSKKDNKFAQEIVPLLSKYNVDLYICGHEHTYLYFEASTFDKYQLPSVLIAGSPGNLEYVRPLSQIDLGGFTFKTLIPKYGYGFLTATTTALEWKWGSTGSDNGTHPQPTSWTLEHQLSFPRQNLACCTPAAGTPVQTPTAMDPTSNTSTNSNSNINASESPSSNPANGTKSSATRTSVSMLVISLCLLQIIRAAIEFH